MWWTIVTFLSLECHWPMQFRSIIDKNSSAFIKYKDNYLHDKVWVWIINLSIFFFDRRANDHTHAQTVHRHNKCIKQRYYKLWVGCSYIYSKCIECTRGYLNDRYYYYYTEKNATKWEFLVALSRKGMCIYKEREREPLEIGAFFKDPLATICREVGDQWQVATASNLCLLSCSLRYAPRRLTAAAFSPHGNRHSRCRHLPTKHKSRSWLCPRRKVKINTFVLSTHRV